MKEKLKRYNLNHSKISNFRKALKVELIANKK